MSSASGTGCRWRIERWARPLGAVAAIFAVAGTGLGQEACWDNDIEPNGFNGRATSPPTFPDIRVVSGFTVPEEGLDISTFRKTSIEDADWVPGLVVEVYVYTDGGFCPGELLLSFETSDVLREFQGYQIFDRDVYEYWISFEPLGLGPGRYHIGSRWPNAVGDGTNYWLTSNGRDGADRTDCFSLDGGNTWNDQGPDWHMAFELLCDGDPPIRGACCLKDGFCVFVREDVCLSFGGVYQGDDVTCEDSDCPPGACCFDDGSCEVLQEGACAAAGGAFQGGRVSCEEADCPTGACCFDDGSCERLARFLCDDAGGAFQGNGVSCEDAGCPQPGACCFDDGSCEALLNDACADAGGAFQGKDVSCVDADCPAQLGACCFDDGSCEVLLSNSCAQRGGNFQGESVACEDADCPTGACCFDDGSCERVARFECQDAGGAFQGNGVSCEDVECPQPGACCFDDGSCTFVLNDACVVSGGAFQGEDVSCEDAECPVLAGACCFIDGSCESLRLVPCAQRGGDFQGEGVACEDADCPQPPGDCWDNDIVANGFNARAVSPPLFPDIRVADDFVVPADGLEVTTLRKTCIEDAGWQAVLPVEVYLYDDGGDCPGSQLLSFQTSSVTRVFLGEQLFDRDVYEYWIAFDPIVFDAGRYYVGSRWPNGGGTGTNYWLTSDGGAGIVRPGCFSLDSGSTWQTEGDGWNHAFELLCTDARGACCLSDGTCVDDVTERECRDTERFALYQGDDTTCADVECKARPCPADLDGDEDVDFDDLVILIAAWGPCPDCPADIDRDGDVDFDDLLVLLDTWGPCPGA